MTRDRIFANARTTLDEIYLDVVDHLTLDEHREFAGLTARLQEILRLKMGKRDDS